MSKAEFGGEEAIDADDARRLTDGRRQRRDRNKRAVLDAYLDLIAEGDERPSVAEVSQRSGVSHRSVFRYFADSDDLARSSIERHLERIKPLLWIEFHPSESLELRIDRVLHARLKLFPNIVGVARLQRKLAPTNEIVRELLTRNREMARKQLRWVFGPELERMEPEAARDVLYVLDLICSFEAAELFTSDLRLGADEILRVARRSMLTLLGG